MASSIVLFSILFVSVIACPCANKDKEQPSPQPTANSDFDWKTADRIRLAQNVLFSPPKMETPLCGDGWEVMKESCYYVERDEKLSYNLAEKKCRNLGATLFVPNTKEEYELLAFDAPQNFFTWSGLTKKTDTSEPQWSSPEGVDFKQLNWINQPYGDAVNGWSTASQCAAHFNSVTKYTFWYPCDFANYYICERNATLVH